MKYMLNGFIVILALCCLISWWADWYIKRRQWQHYKEVSGHDGVSFRFWCKYINKERRSRR